ncbi:MAG: DUF2202 domain-containing protein [Psychrilyobacter sp.]|nr:DUF2202 domain-containing protein [Psychrilyobacter sp.]
MKKRLLGVIMMLVMSVGVFASYGHVGASEDDNMSVEAMIKYAIEDEVFARAEYEKIMEIFNIDRPFSNIKRAEETHMELLQPLIKKYDVTYEELDEKDLVIPKTLKETYEVGVQAEIDNIAMYEKFLKDKNLPEDVEETFIKLRDGSKNHLSAFQRQLDRKY